MKVNKTYKVELKPTKSQVIYFMKACGVSRFTYNWGINEVKNDFENGIKNISAYNLIKRLNSIKNTDFPWMEEVTHCAHEFPLKDLEKAFKGFFRNLKKGVTPGFPKEKKRSRGNFSFRLRDNAFIIGEDTIRVQRLGKVKLKEKGYIPLNPLKKCYCTIKKESDKWYASVCCEVEIEDPTTNIEETLGIDLGIKNLITCSNGKYYSNPKFLIRSEKKIKRFQRTLDRRKLGSVNREKAKIRVGRVFKKVSNQRFYMIHKMTSVLVKTKPRHFILEDLNVEKLLKGDLSKYFFDASLYEIKRQLIYKSVWYGGKVDLISRWFPSSKQCSKCKHVKKSLKLSDRVYMCEECGLKIDRDLNAAINIRNEGLTKNTVNSTGINACGDERIQECKIPVLVDETRNTIGV